MAKEKKEVTKEELTEIFKRSCDRNRGRGVVIVKRDQLKKVVPDIASVLEDPAAAKTETELVRVKVHKFAAALASDEKKPAPAPATKPDAKS